MWYIQRTLSASWNVLFLRDTAALNHLLSTGYSTQGDTGYAVHYEFRLRNKYLECIECVCQIIFYAISVLIDRPWCDKRLECILHGYVRHLSWACRTLAMWSEAPTASKIFRLVNLWRNSDPDTTIFKREYVIGISFAEVWTVVHCLSYHTSN